MAYIDGNRIPAILGVSSADGASVIPVYGNETNNSLKVDDDTTGSSFGDTDDKRDDNRKVAFMAVSAVDGDTLVPIYVDPVTNKLLINSN